MHRAFAIARVVFRERCQHRRRLPEHRDPEPHDVSQEVVLQALQRVSEENRAAYILVNEEGLTVNEAAAVLGTTARAAKRRAHRADAQLRTALDATGSKRMQR